MHLSHEQTLCVSIKSGFTTCSKVLSGWPTCPPVFNPLLFLRLLGLGFFSPSLDGGLLLLLLFFASWPSNSLMRNFSLCIFWSFSCNSNRKPFIAFSTAFSISVLFLTYPFACSSKIIFFIIIHSIARNDANSVQISSASYGNPVAGIRIYKITHYYLPTRL